MKHREKDTRIYWDIDPKPIQDHSQQTLHIDELCSINTIKDNYSLYENTVSPTNIISKGFFQSEVQKALQNSQIEKA